MLGVWAHPSEYSCKAAVHRHEPACKEPPWWRLNKQPSYWRLVMRFPDRQLQIWWRLHLPCACYRRQLISITNSTHLYEVSFLVFICFSNLLQLTSVSTNKYTIYLVMKVAFARLAKTLNLFRFNIVISYRLRRVVRDFQRHVYACLNLDGIRTWCMYAYVGVHACIPILFYHISDHYVLR